MKIIIINGSPRTNGFTATILHSMEANLISKGAEVEYFDLSSLKMEQCRGCCSCYQTGHCHIKDDAERLSTMIASADGLILGSPTYASNVTGLMKVFIDRGHFVIEQLLTGKYCVTVATGENHGNRDANKVLKNLVTYSGGTLIGSVVMNATFNSVRFSDLDKTHNKAQDKTQNGVQNRAHDRSQLVEFRMKTMKISNQLYDAISKKKTYPIQRIFHWFILNIGIKPLVKRKGDKYQGVVDKWTRLGII